MGVGEFVAQSPEVIRSQNRGYMIGWIPCIGWWVIDTLKINMESQKTKIETGCENQHAG